MYDVCLSVLGGEIRTRREEVIRFSPEPDIVRIDLVDLFISVTERAGE